uniref:Prevent-host-death family protein n=1 Tax=mine drainage metagenome TaxID=410659 RepID=E6PCW6_9ZZZZ
MQQRQPDPFFDQLAADLREGIEAANRGDVVDADVVWRELGLDIPPPAAH